VNEEPVRISLLCGNVDGLHHVSSINNNFSSWLFLTEHTNLSVSLFFLKSNFLYAAILFFCNVFIIIRIKIYPI